MRIPQSLPFPLALFRRILLLLAVCGGYPLLSLQARTFQPVPKPSLEPNQVIELIQKKNPWLAQDAGTRVIAVVWSPLSVSDTGAQEKSYYYAEPATGRHLNLGIAGGHDEWSWFVTYVIKNPMPVSYSHGILQAAATFQVEENGNVVKVWCDNA